MNVLLLRRLTLLGGTVLLTCITATASLLAESVIRADFNGDGILDLAVVNPDADRVCVFLGDGKGGYGPGACFPVGNRPVSLTAADFNNDGNLDLATANSGSNDISILLGVGDGTFGEATNFPAGIGPVVIIAGDFDANGIADLAVANSGSHDISILLGVGDGSFDAPRSFAFVGQPTDMIAEDLNGDGCVDLVIITRDGFCTLLGSCQGDFSGLRCGSFRQVANATRSAECNAGFNSQTNSCK